tara:strand:+ start:492 stop:884 length:393 start_codon:yes stop_codon:yes gene_type:complete
MNFFKLATVVATLTGFAQITSAADLGSNLALNTDVKATYLVDAETTVATINPEFSYTGLTALELTAGTTLNLWENVGTTSDITDEWNHLPVLAFGATYTLAPNLDVEANMNYDLEATKRGDISLAATFSF